MKKKDVKNYFNAIRNNDLSKVIELVSSDKEYLNACNFAPPKKDDGQSGLQVSFKVGNFEIAKYLIEQNIDVNFMEDSEINEWRAPVLHDCIRATIFNCIKFEKDVSRFDKGFELLKEMLQRKANPNAIDTYGNNCLNRALMDARQVLDGTDDFENGILIQQLRSVFKELISFGANPKEKNDRRESLEFYISNDRMEKYKLI